MVKQIQTIRRLFPTNCLSVFDHIVGLALKVFNFRKMKPFKTHRNTTLYEGQLWIKQNLCTYQKRSSLKVSFPVLLIIKVFIQYFSGIIFKSGTGKKSVKALIGRRWFSINETSNDQNLLGFYVKFHRGWNIPVMPNQNIYGLLQIKIIQDWWGFCLLHNPPVWLCKQLNTHF